MVRRPEHVVASTLARRYYSDEQLWGTAVKWPLHERTDLNLPFWLPEEETDLWCGMSERERCFHAFCRQYADLSLAGEVVTVDYEDFVQCPRRWLDRLCRLFAFADGPRTSELLATVAEPQRDRGSVADGVRPELVARARELHGLWAAAAQCTLTAAA
jgi:hypothetical protein